MEYLRHFNALLKGFSEYVYSLLQLIQFFQNEEIFVQLDELDELDRITHAWIGFNYSLIQAEKTF